MGSSTDEQVFEDDCSSAALVPPFAGDRGEPWRDAPGVPRRARLAAFERGGGEIDVLCQPGIDEVRRREPAANRGYPLDAVFASQALEGGAQIVAMYRDEPDPRPRVERRLVARETLVTGDHDHTLTWNVEHQRVEVKTATFRQDDLSRVTRQAERCAQLDQLRLPHRKERLAVNAARARQDCVGGDTGKAFIDQMLIGWATAERRWIGPARIAI